MCGSVTLILAENFQEQIQVAPHSMSILLLKEFDEEFVGVEQNKGISKPRFSNSLVGTLSRPVTAKWRTLCYRLRR